MLLWFNSLLFPPQVIVPVGGGHGAHSHPVPTFATVIKDGRIERDNVIVQLLLETVTIAKV
jgi:hypothetical protein